MADVGRTPLGRTAIGQDEAVNVNPVFIGAPYQIFSSPNGNEVALVVEVSGFYATSLDWGISSTSGCGTAVFEFSATSGATVNSNTIFFTPSLTWSPPVYFTIYVTDGTHTISTTVSIRLVSLIRLPIRMLNMDNYEIFLADRNFVKRAQISYYTQATFVTRFNDVGSFSIEMDVANASKVGWGSTGSGTYNGIILERNGNPIFLGLITEFQRRLEKGVNKLTINGSCVLKLIADRLALPDPNRPTIYDDSYGDDVPDYSRTLSDVRPASTVTVGTNNAGIINSGGVAPKSGGATVGTSPRTYRITIKELGTDGDPDKFKWQLTSTDPDGPESSGIEITGKAQTIDSGILSIVFASKTGHTVGQYTDITITDSYEKSEKVIKDYIRYNMVAGYATAFVTRQQPNFVVEADHSPLYGNSVRGKARFDNLLELIKSLTLSRPIISEDNLEVRFFIEKRVGSIGLEFKVAPVRDRTRNIVLSEDLGTLKSFDYSAKAPAGNYLYIGGKGSEGERYVHETGGPAGTLEASVDKHGLIEKFVDSSGGETFTDLYATGILELNKIAESTSVEAVPSNIPNMEIIDDYWVGDKVTTIVDGSEFQEVIREITIALDRDNGALITPVIGSPDTRKKELLNVFSQVRKLDGRISPFERR